MKKSSHAFVNQVFVCVLVSIGFGGSIGLGTVWLRHQMSIAADANRFLAGRLAQIEREIAETKTLVESQQSPDALRRLNAEMRLGLVPVSDGQLVHVTEDPIQRMVARANRELFNDGPKPVMFQVALQR